MAELKDKDEQYSTFLKYKENDEEDESKLIIFLRIVFVTFFMVAITVLTMFIISNYDDISTII